MRARKPYIGRNIALAAAYFVAGQLSLLLAIPPGFATPVWPAAGIALAAVLVWGSRVLPGIVLGSFAINLALAARSSADLASLAPYALAFSIALGAALQARVSAWLIGKFAAFPSRLGSVREVFALIALGGGLGCLINAFLGPLSLLAAGAIPPGAFAISALTWWAGDAIGVALMTPMLLLASHGQVSTGRKLAVGIPILAFIGLVVIVFFNAKNSDRERQQIEFSATAAVLASDFAQRLNAYLDVLTATEKFIESSNSISFEEYRRFTREFTSKYPGIYSVAWLPRITPATRDAYEADLSAELNMPVRIFDRVDVSQYVAAPDRAVYFPVTYSVPLERNRAAIGLDTYGPDGLIGFARRDAQDLARDLAQPESSGPITVVQAENQIGVVVYNPVYAQGWRGDDVAGRRAALIGYTAGVFLIPPMMDTLASNSASAGMSIVLKSISASPENALLFDSRQADDPNPEAAPAMAPMALWHTEKLQFAHRDWELLFIQTPETLLRGDARGLWYLLLGGLFLSSLVGAFLIVLSANLDGTELSQAERVNLLALTSAIATAILLLLVTSLITRHLHQQAESDFANSVDYDLQIVSEGIREHLRATLSSLRRIARRLETGAISPQTWQRDAENHLQDLSALRAIALLDADGTLRQSATHSPLEGTAIADLLKSAPPPIDIEVDDLGGVHLNPPLAGQPAARSRLIIAFAPVFSSGRLAQYVVGVLDLAQEVRKLVPTRQQERYAIRIDDGTATLLEQGRWNSGIQGWERTRAVSLFNRDWQVYLRPTEDTHQHMLLPRMLAVSGALLSLLAAFIVYVATIASQRSRLLQEKTRQLIVSEGRLNQILASAGEGIYGLDTEGRMTFMNPAAAAILGYTAEELRDRKMHSIIHHSTAEGAPIRQRDCKIYATLHQGKSQTDDSEVFWRKDGQAIPVEYTSSPLKQDDERIVGAVVVFKEITRRKQAEQALLAANAELEEFAYRTSHDLRSPLVSSIELLNLTRRFYQEDNREQAEFSLSMAQDCLRQLDTLVQNILVLTRTKNIEEDQHGIDFVKLIDGVLEKMAHLPGFEQLHIQIDVDVPTEVFLMPSRMELIAENLISNAIKYQDPEQPHPQIQIAARLRGQHFSFTVSDNGLGVPEEHQNKLFSMFKRLHSDVSFGSGLGLYMVKKSAEVLGGTVSYEAGNPGSRFCFSVQLKK